MSDVDVPTNGTQPDTISTHQALQVYADLFRRLTMTRAGLTFAGKRDLYETLGYRRDLRYQDYYERYVRGGIAARIIDAFPAATWRLHPIIREIGKPDEGVKSPFELAWEALTARLRLWAHLARVDRLASLGHYAVLVFGLRGQTAWAGEAQRVHGPDDLLYVQAFSEEHAKIVSLVNVDTSPLFGRPGQYTVDFSRRLTRSGLFDPTLLPSLAAQYGSLVTVHASRAIHVAENGLEDDIIGTPRLRAIWNYLDDLEKTVGGMGEMFWQDAKRRLVLALAADAQMQQSDIDVMDTKVEEFVHELRNVLKVQGIEVTQLEGKIPDASGIIDKQVDLIAGAIGMPKRLLIGSERGELASTQDEANWLQGTIRDRQMAYAEPVCLRPLLDHCIALNILPTPVDGYAVEWPNLLSLTEKERAAIVLDWSRAIATYAGPMASPQEVFPLLMFLGDIMEFSPEQVERIMELLGGAVGAEDGV